MGVFNVKRCVRKQEGRTHPNNRIQSLKQGRVQSIINKNKEGSSRNWNLVRKHSKHVADMRLKEHAVVTAAEKLEEQQAALASNEHKHSVMLAREQTALEKQLQVAKQLEVDLQASAIETEKAAAEAEQRLQDYQASAEQAEQRLLEQRELIERLQAKGTSFEEEMQSRDEGHVNALAEKASETDSQLKQKEEQHRKALDLALAEMDAGTATLLADARSKLEETEFKLEEANRERRQSSAYVADLENKLDEAETVRQSSNQASAQEYGSSQGDGAGSERFIEFECVVTVIGGIGSLLIAGRQHKLTVTQSGLGFQGYDAVDSDADICPSTWAQIPKWRLDRNTERESEFRFEQSNPGRQVVLRLLTADGQSLMQVLNARCTMVVPCYCISEPTGDCAEETELILSHEDGITVHGPPVQWLWWEDVAMWELESAASEENNGEGEMDFCSYSR
jgi:hypothetical protein